MKKRILRTVSYFLTIVLVSFIATSAVFYVKLNRSHDKLEDAVRLESEAISAIKEGNLLLACRALVKAQNNLKNADFSSGDTLGLVHSSSIEICSKINKN